MYGGIWRPGRCGPESDAWDVWRFSSSCSGAVGCGLLSPAPGIDRADPRFAQCSGNHAKVEAAFPLIASEYRDHFPFATFGPAMEVDTPAFAVVFAEGENPLRGHIGGPGAPVADGEDLPPVRTGPPPGAFVGRVVCIYLGPPPKRHTIYYSGVNVAGMRE